MITVGYEQARGLRVKHQKAEGFEVGRTRTLGVGAGEAYAAWSDEGRRVAWLGEEGRAVEARKCVEGKSIRWTWGDGRSVVVVALAPRGEARTQVSVQHGKLASAEEAEAMKAFWSAALERLAEHCEGA
jgi:uncharacterized protein YndB with AHSA1/START domain